MASPVSDYTSLDFDSLLADAKRYARSQLGITYSNDNPSDVGVMLVAVAAYIGDLMGYNVNQLTFETIATTASRMANFTRAAKTYGFTPSPATAAGGDLDVVVDISGGDVDITTHHKFGTQAGLVFQPTADQTVPGGVGTTTVTVAVTEGDETQDEAVATSSGTASQRYALRGKPLLSGTLLVYVDGTLWDEVSVVALAESTDNAYQIETEDDGTTFLVFGDGINGAIPGAGLAITATYKAGGGDAGNVAEDTVTQLVDVPAEVLSANNSAAFSGGGPAQSLFSAQATLPGFIRANDRCVQDADYAAEAILVSGISKAAATSGTNGEGGCGAPLYLFAAPSGGGSLTAAQIAAIQARLSTRKMANRKVIVRDKTTVELDVAVDVRVLGTSRADAVAVLVKNVILDRYDFASVGFGEAFVLQELNELLLASNIKGVESALVRRFSVVPHYFRYLRFTPTGDGTVEHIDVDVGEGLRREWRIEMTSATTFDVYQRMIGTATELSDVAMGDDAADFPESNGLVTSPAWYLILDPYTPGYTRKEVVGNTLTSVTVDSGDLRDLGAVGGEYAVERVQTATGKVYRDTYVGTISGGATTLPLPGAGWSVNDYLWVSCTGTATAFRTRITGGSAGAWTVSVAVPTLGLSGTVTADALFVDDSGSFQCAVVAGGTPFVSGDTLAVDTYQDLADVRLRPLDYPELTETNLAIRTIGGR